MSDARGQPGGTMLRRALLLTAGCGAAAVMVPRWMAGSPVAPAAVAPDMSRAARSEAATPSSAPAPAEEAATVFDSELTFQAGRNNQFFVHAAVNGIEIPFIVDTGAFRVALRPDDAQAVGFDLSNLHWDVPVSTANGNAYAASVTLASVRLDRITEYNVPATVMQQRSGSPSLLGMSFLSRLKSWRIHDGVLTIRY